jgi:hypothetical protein
MRRIARFRAASAILAPLGPPGPAEGASLVEVPVLDEPLDALRWRSCRIATCAAAKIENQISIWFSHDACFGV